MKVRAVVPDRNISTWWRVIQPFEYLRKNWNVDVGLINYNNSLDTWDVDNSLVIVHRIIPGNANDYVRSLRDKGAIQVIYSIDDYTTNEVVLKHYLEACGAITGLAVENIVSRVKDQVAMIQACDDYICTTPELRNLIYDDTGKTGTVIGNAIPEDFFLEGLDVHCEYQGNSETVYIGWAGGRRPEADLENMAIAWGRINRDFPNVRFIVAGWQPDVIDRNIDLDKKIRLPWVDIDKWPRSMQVDIGCCPLNDTPYNQGKSPIKWFEYTMAGAACVVSSIVYGNYITDGLGAIQAHYPDEWYVALKTLISNKHTRRRLVNIAQYDVHNYYTLDNVGLDWYHYFEDMMNESSISNRPNREQSSILLARTQPC